MKNKTLGVGVLALALPALLLSANAVGANAATVTSSVSAIDSCQWQIAGLPDDMTLGPADDAKYKGDALLVEATASNLLLGLAGTGDSVSATDTEDSSECSFYNSLKAGVITVAINGSDFVAEYTEDGGSTYVPDPDDNTLDFSLSGVGPLTVTTDSSDCGTEFDVESSVALSVALTPGQLISTMITGDPEDPQTLVNNVNVTGANVKCDVGLTFGVTILAHTGVPAGAGYPYRFTGPEITFALPVVE